MLVILKGRNGKRSANTHSHLRVLFIWKAWGCVFTNCSPGLGMTVSSELLHNKADDLHLCLQYPWKS